MNIIIVGKAHAAPTRIDLDSPRGRWLAGGILGASALALLATGFASAFFFTSSTARDLHEIAGLKATITAERAELANLDRESERDLDALTLQLGQLQAQATRLNALGDRLTEVGKLDDGEFDFSSDPALGGPEEPATGAAAPLPISAGIQNLRAEFDRQEAQLGVLENLLLDRKVDNALLPSGMPVAQGTSPPDSASAPIRSTAIRRSISASISTRPPARPSRPSPKASSASSACDRVTATSSKSTTATAT
jgi:hypothetical protein